MLSGLLGTLGYFWAAYGCLAVGLIYLFAARSGTPPGQRLAGSAYAPVAAALFVAATLTDFSLGPIRGLPLFVLLQALPLALLVYSLRRYPVPRAVHVVLVPLALLFWGWQLFWGVLGLLGE